VYVDDDDEETLDGGTACMPLGDGSPDDDGVCGAAERE
jgi:hypothetical protein